LLAKDEKEFYWPAICGLSAPFIGGGIPRAFSPCGDVTSIATPRCYSRRLERRYAYFLPVTPPIEECLLVPICIKGKAIGSIWAIAHNDHRKFDAEDLRQMLSAAGWHQWPARRSRFPMPPTIRAALRSTSWRMRSSPARPRKGSTWNCARATNAITRSSSQSTKGSASSEKVECTAGEPPDFRFIEVNPAFEVQSGLTGVIGKTIRQLIPGEADEWSRIYSTILRTGKPVEI